MHIPIYVHTYTFLKGTQKILVALGLQLKKLRPREVRHRTGAFGRANSLIL